MQPSYCKVVRRLPGYLVRAVMPAICGKSYGCDSKQLEFVERQGKLPPSFRRQVNDLAGKSWRGIHSSGKHDGTIEACL